MTKLSYESIQEELDIPITEIKNKIIGRRSQLSREVAKTNQNDKTCFSINTQVIIQNRGLSLARYLGLSADNHLDGQNGRQ